MDHCARTFLPLLIKSTEGVLVNTSSVNGFWATLGPGRPHTTLLDGQVRGAVRRLAHPGWHGE